MTRLFREALSTMSYRVIRWTGSERFSSVRILMYHRVTDAHPADRLCVPVQSFAKQMRWLREAGFETVSVARAVEWIQGDGALPPKPLVITFDDGFEDNVLYGTPALAREGFTACFFVPSGFIESGQPAHPPADRPMTWDQLRALLDGGHEIGAHSVTHRRLTSLNAEELAWEVRHCKTVLEQRLDAPVRFFCYPAGHYDPAVTRVVQAAGYQGACTVKPGSNRQDQDRFALTRTEISAFDSLWDVEKKLAGAYDWMHAAIQSAHRWLPGRRRHPSNAMTV